MMFGIGRKRREAEAKAIIDLIEKATRTLKETVALHQHRPASRDTLARITWELAAKVIPPPDQGNFPDPKWNEENYWRSAEAVLDKARETVNRTLR